MTTAKEEASDGREWTTRVKQATDDACFDMDFVGESGASTRVGCATENNEWKHDAGISFLGTQTHGSFWCKASVTCVLLLAGLDKIKLGVV